MQSRFAAMREMLTRVGFTPEVVMSRHVYVQGGRGSLAVAARKRTLDPLARARPTLGPMIVIVASRA